MNRLFLKQRAQILHLLVEGNSLRATARIADVSRNTVDKLLREVGSACLDYQDKTLRNLTCSKIQVDEIWSFVYSKQRNVPEDRKDEFGCGDVWTWVALCADTKLVPCWHVDDRSTRAATEFMKDLAERLAHRVQLTTDGYHPYFNAVEDAFGSDVDYGQLVKLYGEDKQEARRYSPAKVISAKCGAVTGNPAREHISTSFVERQNLTMRMHMRRFARLTNAFSKKVENHIHAISLHYMYYNFCKIHGTLSTTPAQAAGVCGHIWELEDVAKLVI